MPSLPSNEINDLLFRCFALDNLGNVALRVMMSAFTTAEDIEVTDNSKGLILKSPNGSRFRLKVDNSGVVSTTAL